MKKTLIVIALAAALTLAFSATAFATSAKTWNYQEDYYSWGSTAGNGMSAVASETLGQGGSAGEITGFANTNAANPGVHAGYLANTAKCGICHSVHRANATGTKLLNTATATCAGCHRAGASTVTKVLVTWQTGGPHSSGTDASCNSRGCHLNNPHGAGASQYKIFAAKLIGNMPLVTDSGAKADLSVAYAVANSGASGITADMLNGVTAIDNGTRQAIVVGYTCNSAGCHEQTMLPVINKNYAESRETTYPSGLYTMKTGHITAAADASFTAGVTSGATAHASFNPINGCTSCHDQTDSLTRTGFTFPHSQTAAGTSNLGAGRAYLWMGIASNASGSDLTAMTDPNMKSFDGACLKCHRSSDGLSGIGVSH